MQPFTLNLGQNLSTPTIDFGKVRSIKMDVDNPANPKIWIIYFYGQRKNAKQYIMHMWFFYTEKDRFVQLERTLKQYPHIRIR